MAARLQTQAGGFILGFVTWRTDAYQHLQADQDVERQIGEAGVQTGFDLPATACSLLRCFRFSELSAASVTAH